MNFIPLMVRRKTHLEFDPELYVNIHNFLLSNSVRRYYSVKGVSHVFLGVSAGY